MASNVNLLKLQLINQFRTFIKGVGGFLGVDSEIELDTEVDMKEKLQAFLDNPELAEEMALEDVIILLEDFNDLLEAKPFNEVITSLKTDIEGLRTNMVELLSRPVVETKVETVKTFDTSLFDSLALSVSSLTSKMQGFVGKEEEIKLRRRITDVEEALPVLQENINDLSKEIDVWKKKKDQVTVHRGGGQSMTLAVTSVFGRNGAVLAVAGDYTAAKITYTPSGGLVATQVQAAIDALAARTPDANFTFPFTSLATVTVNHNLNKFPAVTIKDSTGDECIGNINYTSVNQVVITFSAAFTGVVICN